MFTKHSDMANYADDNSPYACKNYIESVISQIEGDSKNPFRVGSKQRFKSQSRQVPPTIE